MNNDNENWKIIMKENDDVMKIIMMMIMKIMIMKW